MAPTNLDGLGGLHGLLGRDAGLPLSQQLLDEVGDVAARDGDVLDAAANHIALGLQVRAHHVVRERERERERTRFSHERERGLYWLTTCHKVLVQMYII